MVEVDRGRADVIVMISGIEAISEQENKGTSSSSMHPAISPRVAPNRATEINVPYMSCVGRYVVSPECPCFVRVACECVFIYLRD